MYTCIDIMTVLIHHIYRRLIHPIRNRELDMSLGSLYGLESSMLKSGVDVSRWEGSEFGDPALHVFTQDLKMGLSCHLESGLLIYFFHDFAIEKSCFGGKITSTKKMMREFDRFVLWHHHHDLANNPFFQSVELQPRQ